MFKQKGISLKNNDDLLRPKSCMIVDNVEERAIKSLISLRIGSHNCSKTRTFHLSIKSVKVFEKKGSKIDYIAGEGKYEDRSDLESLSGNKEELKEIVEKIDKSARLRKGRTCETVLKTIVFELPADSTAKTRKQVADEITEYFDGKGYKGIAAVHCDANTQPHIHVAVASRKLKKVGDAFEIEREAGSVLLMHKRDVYNLRTDVGNIINKICNQAIKFFGGRDIELDVPGIKDRRPKTRLNQHDYYIERKRENSSVVLDELHKKYEAERKAARLAAARKKAEKEAKIAAKYKARGLVKFEEQEKLENLVQNLKTLLAKAREENLNLENNLDELRQTMAEAGALPEAKAKQISPSEKQRRYLYDLLYKQGLSESEIMERFEQIQPSVGEYGRAIKTEERRLKAIRAEVKEADFLKTQKKGGQPSFSDRIKSSVSRDRSECTPVFAEIKNNVVKSPTEGSSKKLDVKVDAQTETSPAAQKLENLIRIDPAARLEPEIQKILKLDDSQILSLLAAQKQAISKASARSMAELELKTGLKAVEKAAIIRGLVIQSKVRLGEITR